MSDDARAAIAAKLDRLASKLARMEPVRPLDVQIAIEAGRDALAVIDELESDMRHYEETVIGDLNERNTRDQRRAARAEAAIARVRALHISARGGRSGYNPDDDDTPGAYGQIANACEECGSQDLAVRWPCPTIQALEQP